MHNMVVHLRDDINRLMCQEKKDDEDLPALSTA